MSIILRKAHSSDYYSFCRLYEQLDRLHSEKLPNIFRLSSSPAREETYFIGLVRNTDICVLMAEENDTPIGMVVAFLLQSGAITIDTPRKFVMVDALIIDPAYRGQGLAQALLSQVEEWAVTKGATSIELKVYEFNQPALSFYQKQGYAGLYRRLEKQLVTQDASENLEFQIVTRTPGQYPLSFTQQYHWLLDKLHPNCLLNHLTAIYELSGKLDLEAFKHSLDAIYHRHSILRARFELDAQQNPVQFIDDNPNPDIHFISLDQFSRMSQQPGMDPQVWLRHVLNREATRPFATQMGRLLRASIVQVGDEKFVLILGSHRLVTDEKSLQIVTHEIFEVYHSLIQGQTRTWPPAAAQYIDFCLNQTIAFQTDKKVEQSQTQKLLSFWKDLLSDPPDSLELPTFQPRPMMPSFKAASYRFSIDDHLAQQIGELSHQEKISTFSSWLAIFQTLLERYSGQNDFILGIPYSMREFDQLLKNGVGPLTETVLYRPKQELQEQVFINESFLQIARRIDHQVDEIINHGHLPYLQIMEAIQARKNLQGTFYAVKFDMKEAFQNIRGELVSVKQYQLDHMNGFPSQPALINPPETDVDLSLTILHSATDSTSPEFSPYPVEVEIHYRRDVFHPQTIERMAGHFQQLGQRMVTHPHLPVDEFSILTDAERDQIISEWNATASDLCHQRLIHQLFETSAQKDPEAPAILFEQQTLTYQELNQISNQIAHFLIGKGVGPESLVAVCLDRSPELIAVILGILKAGGAYLPLDPAYPIDRLAFMLSDSQVEFLLTRTDFQNNFFTSHSPSHVLDSSNPLNTNASQGAQTSPAIIYLDRQAHEIALQNSENPAQDVEQDHLAYVIYTSGSTGKPKGVMVTHRGIPNLCQFEIRALELNAQSRVLQFSSPSFDASVFEIFSALAAGAALVLAKQEDLLPGEPLAQTLLVYRITNVTLPPSALLALPERAFPDLKVIVSAGEACTHELIKRWANGRRFFNAYGPTETTVCVTAAQYPREGNQVAIGSPIDNMQAYILDGNRQPVPVGITGEIHLGGVGLARGYRNRPELTAEKFIPNPFYSAASAASNPSLSERLYRTGDLGRFLPDGNIEFLGRVDQQIKLRGFRIELGEIENALRQHPQIEDAVVIKREDTPNHSQIVAYFTIQKRYQTPSAPRLNASDLRNFLRLSLPDYMLPTAFENLEKIPLSPNGKVNRKELPVPSYANQQQFVAPRSKIETDLVEIWKQILGLNTISVLDNFFLIGGHSLLATRLIWQIKESFQIDLPLRTIFDVPTIAGMAEQIENQQIPGPDLLQTGATEDVHQSFCGAGDREEYEL
jgi:amino acid adenylation domain-containing protein